MEYLTLQDIKQQLVISEDFHDDDTYLTALGDTAEAMVAKQLDKTLEDVVLPNGWTWDAPETSVGNVGDNAFAATYTPDDTANYNTLNQDLTVTVVPVNKTALNDALTNANNYLDTIKNDADYAAPSFSILLLFPSHFALTCMR